MSSQPLVSVVVPTRNSADSLPACLESVVHQTYPSVEILVVDNYSTDTTLDVARAATPFVYTHGPERSAQRNAGAQAAHGAYLFFIDSDMVLDADVVERCVHGCMDNPGVTGIIVPERSVGKGFWARCKALERRCYVGDDTIEAARFFDRATFEAISGYDETLTGPEDWDLSQRARDRGSLRRVNAYITHLEGSLSLRETMRSKYYYGKTMGRYIRKQSGSAARQLQLIRPAFIRHWRLLLAHPVLTGGMIVMKCAEGTAGATGLVLASWRERRADLSA